MGGSRALPFGIAARSAASSSFILPCLLPFHQLPWTGSVQVLLVAVTSQQDAALWTYSVFSALARLATCCFYPSMLPSPAAKSSSKSPAGHTEPACLQPLCRSGYWVWIRSLRDDARSKLQHRLSTDGGQTPPPGSKQTLEGLVLLCALKCYTHIKKKINMQIYTYVHFLQHFPFGPTVQPMPLLRGWRADSRRSQSQGAGEGMKGCCLFGIPAMVGGSRL